MTTAQHAARAALPGSRGASLMSGSVFSPTGWKLPCYTDETSQNSLCVLLVLPCASVGGVPLPAWLQPVVNDLQITKPMSGCEHKAALMALQNREGCRDFYTDWTASLNRHQLEKQKHHSYIIYNILLLQNNFYSTRWGGGRGTTKLKQ